MKKPNATKRGIEILLECVKMGQMAPKENPNMILLSIYDQLKFGGEQVIVQKIGDFSD